MNTVRTIAKNTGFLFASQIASYVFGFFFVMYTARYLGAEGFGVLSFALAFTAIFGVFSDLGLSTLMVREVARDKSLAGKYLGNIIAIKVVLVVITFGMITLAINILEYPDKTIKVVYLIALYVVFGTFSNAFCSIFQAYEKMEYISIGAILNSALMLLGALIAISRGFDVNGFAFTYFLVSVIYLGYNIVVCALKFILPKIEVDWDFWKHTVREALPFGFTVVFVSIYYWIDSVMLSFMQGDEAVGLYNAAYRLITSILFIPATLNTTIFPVMSQLYISSEDALRFAYEKYFKYMVIVAIPLGFGTTIMAERIILLIFGFDYAKSVIALQILIWSTVCIFISSAFARLFESINKQIITTKITGVCVVLNIGLNLILIPKYAYVGASVATVATEFTALGLCFIFSSRIGYTIKNKSILVVGKATGASILMCAFIIYFNELNIIILILLSILVYFLFLYLLGGIEEEDINLLKNVVDIKGD